MMMAGVMMLGVLMSGCFGDNEEQGKRELQRQIDMLESREGLGVAEEEVSEVEVEEEKKDLICGGMAGFLCPDGQVCLGKEEGKADATGVCVKVEEKSAWLLEQEERKLRAVNADTCGVLGEKLNRNPLLGGTGRKCCSGLAEDRVTNSYSICRVRSGEEVAVEEESEVVVEEEEEVTPVIEEEEESEEEVTPVVTDWNVKGFTRYVTNTGGFEISYPQYWYYGGFGALEGSLWLAGFAKEPLEDEGGNIVIKAKLMSGQSEGRSGNGWCAANLGSENWMRVEGPESLEGILCQMADSAEIVE